MRYLILLSILLVGHASFAVAAAGESFKNFMESREVLATIYFSTGSDTLSASETMKLKQFLPQMKRAQENGRMIRVEGFSSPDGDRSANFSLSLFRARAVATQVAEMGLGEELVVTGYGDLAAAHGISGKERKAEIVSYEKPEKTKKVRVVREKTENREPERPVSSIKEPVEEVVVASTHLEPVIDALAIEQAIMEKIGVEPILPSGRVSRID